MIMISKFIRWLRYRCVGQQEGDREFSPASGVEPMACVECSQSAQRADLRFRQGQLEAAWLSSQAHAQWNKDVFFSLVMLLMGSVGVVCNVARAGRD